jgi:hypothetical protein
MIFEQRHFVARDGSHPIEAVRLSNVTRGNDLSNDQPPLEAVWQYGAWSTEVAAEPFVRNILHAATKDRRRATIWLPSESVLKPFTDDDQWARLGPILSRVADKHEAPVYLAPHSIAVSRAASEAVASPLVQGVVALTPSHTPSEESRGVARRIASEGLHWRTLGSTVGNLATTASLFTGFSVRAMTRPATTLHESHRGLSVEAIDNLAKVSQEKPTGVLLALHDKVFAFDSVLKCLEESNFRGIARAIPATHISAYVNHRNGKHFYKLWADTAQTC